MERTAVSPDRSLHSTSSASYIPTKIKLPLVEAVKAEFPPGCKVLCFKDNGFYIGSVKNVMVSISLTSKNTYETFYEIETKKRGDSDSHRIGIVSSSNLRFTPDTPIEVNADFFGSLSKYAKESNGRVRGIVLGSFELPPSQCHTCAKNGGGSHRERSFFYSVRVQFLGMKEVVEAHGVPPQQLRYWNTRIVSSLETPDTQGIATNVSNENTSLRMNIRASPSNRRKIHHTTPELTDQASATDEQAGESFNVSFNETTRHENNTRGLRNLNVSHSYGEDEHSPKNSKMNLVSSTRSRDTVRSAPLDSSSGWNTFKNQNPPSSTRSSTHINCSGTSSTHFAENSPRQQGAFFGDMKYKRRKDNNNAESNESQNCDDEDGNSCKQSGRNPNSSTRSRDSGRSQHTHFAENSPHQQGAFFGDMKYKRRKDNNKAEPNESKGCVDEDGNSCKQSGRNPISSTRSRDTVRTEPPDVGVGYSLHTNTQRSHAHFDENPVDQSLCNPRERFDGSSSKNFGMNQVPSIRGRDTVRSRPPDSPAYSLRTTSPRNRTRLEESPHSQMGGFFGNTQYARSIKNLNSNNNGESKEDYEEQAETLGISPRKGNGQRDIVQYLNEQDVEDEYYEIKPWCNPASIDITQQSGVVNEEGSKKVESPFTSFVKKKRFGSTWSPTVSSSGEIIQHGHKNTIYDDAQQPASPVASETTISSQASNIHVGCYLLFEETSNGKFVVRYSMNVVPKALGFWCPGRSVHLKSFKFNQNEGKSDLMKDIAGKHYRKNYFNGWCQFIKAAKMNEGSVCKWSQHQRIELDIYVFFDDSCEIQKIEDGELFDVSEIDAVAVLPKGNTTFTGVHSGEIGNFLNKGHAAGVSMRIK